MHKTSIGLQLTFFFLVTYPFFVFFFGADTRSANVNQHPPVHHQEWMDDIWWGNNFLLGSSSLANHGG
jgi:hypothetical protein